MKKILLIIVFSSFVIITIDFSLISIAENKFFSNKFGETCTLELKDNKVSLGAESKKELIDYLNSFNEREQELFKTYERGTLQSVLKIEIMENKKKYDIEINISEKNRILEVFVYDGRRSFSRCYIITDEDEKILERIKH